MEVMVNGDVTRLECTHVFHSRCLVSRYGSSSSSLCPVCRADLCPKSYVKDVGSRHSKVIVDLEVELLNIKIVIDIWITGFERKGCYQRRQLSPQAWQDIP